MGERLRFSVPDDLDGERLDKVVSVLGGISRAAARRIVDAAAATLDGEAFPARHRVAAGQILSFPAPEEVEGIEPEDVPFEVVYEDEDVIVVDKPAGLVVHPGAGRDRGTLVAGLLHRRPELAGIGDPERPGIVHRLDRDTSGLLVVAGSDLGYEGLREQVAAREMEREYLALVDGLFEVPTGTVDAPIARDHNRPTRRRVDPTGRPARTHYRLERAFPEAQMSLLAVRLETGRTHQIRVHLAAIDHPLAGDPVYRPGPDRVEVPRLFLHACRLGFIHPRTGEELTFESPLPEDLAAVLERLR
ncbi:MAG TPA: RluA family pseudouridine synthase [Acidimicrobiia bacterium]|nr:RluA family pseudouridine synthase [Acidimicrobiia bacterium]